MGQYAVPVAPHVGVRALGNPGIGTRTARAVWWIVTLTARGRKSVKMRQTPVKTVPSVDTFERGWAEMAGNAWGLK